MSTGDPQPTIPGLDVPEAARGSAAPAPAAPVGPETRRVVRVLPDVVGIDKEFDYAVPDGVEVGVGDVVRVVLGGRRVGAWVVAVDVPAPDGVALRALAKVSGRGPAPELIDLAGWAAWRWAGKRAHLLRTAAPPGVVRALPAPAARPAPIADGGGDEALADALARPRAVLRLAPAADRYALVRAAVATPGPVPDGRTLVLCPSVAEARQLGARLRRDGVAVAVVAHDQPGAAAAGDWARAAAGAVVVGARAAAWAPVTPLGRVVVLDEHDEGYQQEQAPTWHARDVAVERAHRAGAPCLLVSPCPTLEALAWGELVVTDRQRERRGWPRVQVVDQRELDPALGPLFSPTVVDLARSDDRVLCVLNRTGRARLLACTACATLARCEVCDAAVSTAEPGPATPEGAPAAFACGRCGVQRPQVCTACGGSRFKNLRLGVSKVREELEVLAGRPVHEVTAATADDDPALVEGGLLVGTEAVLHRVTHADAVVFLDFDQELLSLRYRASEQALGLLARAARLVRRGSGPHGRLVVQTRTPEHPAVLAAHHADPERLVQAELPMRHTLGLPPTRAMAVVSGEAAVPFVEALGRPDGLQVQGPVDGTWRLRAVDHRILCDALAAVPRPPGRLRIEVDPLRI